MISWHKETHFPGRTEMVSGEYSHSLQSLLLNINFWLYSQNIDPLIIWTGVWENKNSVSNSCHRRYAPLLCSSSSWGPLTRNTLQIFAKGDERAYGILLLGSSNSSCKEFIVLHKKAKILAFSLPNLHILSSPNSPKYFL